MTATHDTSKGKTEIVEDIRFSIIRAKANALDKRANLETALDLAFRWPSAVIADGDNVKSRAAGIAREFGYELTELTEWAKETHDFGADAYWSE